MCSQSPPPLHARSIAGCRRATRRTRKRAPLAERPFEKSFGARTLGGKRLLGLLDNRLEGRAFVHGEVCHYLAIQLDAGQLGTVHELRIGQAFGANCRVDTLDPQSAEIPLLDLAVAVSVLAGLFDRLTGDADGVLATAAIALRLIEDPLVLLARGDAAFTKICRTQ